MTTTPEPSEIGFRRIVAVSVSANDVVAWIELGPEPDQRWLALFFGLATHSGEAPPMLRADGQVTVRGSLDNDEIGHVVDALRTDIAATNAAYRRGESPRRRPSNRETSNTAAESAAIRDRLSRRLVNPAT